MPDPAAPRRRDRLAVAVFLLAFLLPMLLRATAPELRIPGTPRILAKLHDIACLFPTKPSGWSSYYVQVLYPGDKQWTTLDQSELFPLQPFGRRTRMHRYLVAWGAKPGKRTADMARWILERWAVLHEGEVQPVAIRFTLAWTVPSRERPPQHGWVQPEWIHVPTNQRKVIATYAREELLGP
ncbi:hypothetical protein ACNOYE_02505 [Nannocystaceae bacterium ST9]